jgi:thymidine kinase
LDEKKKRRKHAKRPVKKMKESNDVRTNDEVVSSDVQTEVTDQVIKKKKNINLDFGKMTNQQMAFVS